MHNFLDRKNYPLYGVTVHVGTYIHFCGIYVHLNSMFLLT